MRAGNRPRRRARFRRAIAFRAICQKSKCLDRIIVLQITRFVSLELMIGILTSSVLSLLLMQDPATLFQRAYQMQQAGDYTHAAEAYIEFLKLRPDEVAGISNLGVVLVKLGRYEQPIVDASADLSVASAAEVNAVAVTFRAHLHGSTVHTLDPWRWPSSSWATSVWVLPDAVRVGSGETLRIRYSRRVRGQADGLTCGASSVLDDAEVVGQRHHPGNPVPVKSPGS